MSTDDPIEAMVLLRHHADVISQLAGQVIAGSDPIDPKLLDDIQQHEQRQMDLLAVLRNLGPAQTTVA